MQTVNFDYAIDMTDSSVFAQGFWDNEARMLYLVFNNGTRAARHIAGWTTPIVETVSSWGRIWNSTLRFLPAVELEENVQFVERTAEVDETEVVGSETAYSFDEDAGTLTPDEDGESAGPFQAAEVEELNALFTVSIDFDTERVASLLEAGTEFLDAAQDTVVTAVGEATEFVTGLFDRVRGNK